MKLNNFEQDSEETPIKSSDYNKLGDFKRKKKSEKKSKCKNFYKCYPLFIFIGAMIFFIRYFNDNKMTVLELNNKIQGLQTKIQQIEKDYVKKKIGIAFVNPNFHGNGIGRLLSVLTELLVKTGKYDVYLITEQSTSVDFKHHKKVKREVQKKDEQIMKDFDEEKDIDIYILNNDVSERMGLYRSYGKKIVGIYHGVYLSCVFTNEPNIYNSWYLFSEFDAFIHIIPDDYWVYDELGFNNTIFIPNVYAFEHKNTPSSKLTYKNVLMVGRVEDIIKGAKFGIMAMAEILKEVPDAKLSIVSFSHPKKLDDLIDELGIKDSVTWYGFQKNISQFYLNSSVLLVTSVSESFPMVMNEGKAHGLPIVAFNIEYSPCFQKGVITVDMYNTTQMGREAAKLLKDYNYRKKKGIEAKLSLDMFNNNDTIDIWDNMFQSIMKGKEEYQKYRQKVRQKYYHESEAKKHIESQYKYGQMFNDKYRCHSLENFTTLKYIRNIQSCKINNETK